MKVCFINTFYHPDQVGGAEESVRTLAESLIVAGDEACVITSGPRDSVEVIAGVKIYRLRILNIYGLLYAGRLRKYTNFIWHALDTYNPGMLFKVKNILKKENPDVLHCNNLKGFSVAAYSAAKALNIPVVHTIRDYYLLCPKGVMFKDGVNCDKQCLVCSFFGITRRLLTSRVDCVVGISRYVLDRHVGMQYFPNASRVVVHNSYQRDSLPFPPSRSQAEFVIGYLGRVAPFKGIELLLEEFLSLDDDRLTLKIAGAGEEAYVESLRGTYHSQRITFEGFRVAEAFYKTIDVLVVPSLWNEPLGRVIFEAYAHAVPVLAARRGGMPEIIEDQNTGFLFDPERPGSLAEGLKKIFQDGTLNDMRKNALEKYDQFTPEKSRDAYLKVYRCVVA